MTAPQILGTITASAGTYAIGVVEFTPAPVPVKRPLLAGTDAVPVNLTRTPTTRYVRVYNQPGHGLSASIGAIPAGVTPHVSFKDAPTAAMVNSFLNILTRPIFLTFNHEPEGDLSTVAYQAYWDALSSLVALHRNGHLVTLVEVFTGYAQEHGKTGPDGKDTLAEHMWSGRASMVGVDVYQDHAALTYPTYAALTKRAYAIAKALGVPLMFPEWGRQPIPDDTAGHGVGLAYADDIAQAEADGIVAMGLWDNGGCSLTTGHQLGYVNAAMAALSA